MIGFFRLLFYAVVGYLVYKFLNLLLGPRAETRAPHRTDGRSGVMVKDEVCKTYLPREDAIRETFGGGERFFCSPACRSKFLEESRRGESAARKAS